MKEPRFANQIVLHGLFGLDRVAIRASIQMPDSTVRIELMSIVESSINLLHAIGHELRLCSIVYKLDDE